MEVKESGATGDIYPVLLQYQGSANLIFWKEGVRARTDFYLKLKSGRLATAQTSRDISRLFGSSARAVIHWSDMLVLNLDWFFSHLRALREGASTTRAISGRLLDFWNCLDDLYFSLKIQHTKRGRSSRLIESIYSKLYRRTELPSPIKRQQRADARWKQKELRVFRKFMRERWNTILSQAPEIIVD